MTRRRSAAHKTRAVFDRYHIISECMKQNADKLDQQHKAKEAALEAFLNPGMGQDGAARQKARPH